MSRCLAETCNLRYIRINNAFICPKCISLSSTLYTNPNSPFDLRLHTHNKMSRQQSRRPQASDQEAINYGDVFGFAGAGSSPTSAQTDEVDKSGISIGEALEATAISAGDKPIDRGDAAAIRAAEVRAVGSSVTQRSSNLGAKADAAVNFNDRVAYDYNKITISDVLSDATAKLPQDKAVTSEDADGVRVAELSNNPDAMPTPGGVADTMATAARVNRDDNP